MPVFFSLVDEGLCFQLNKVEKTTLITSKESHLERLY